MEDAKTFDHSFLEPKFLQKNRLLEGTPIKKRENHFLKIQNNNSEKKELILRKSIRFVSSGKRNSSLQLDSKRKMPFVRNYDENLTKKKPLTRTFGLQISRIAEIFKEKEEKTIENEIVHANRFKFSKNNVNLIMQEREKNLKEKVETLTKDMRNELIHNLEKTDQLRKLRESVFCQKMEKLLENSLEKYIINYFILEI